MKKVRREIPSDFFVWGRSVLVGALCADAEVQLLHALDLVADPLERADRAVGGQTFEDVGESAGDVAGLLGVGLHGGVIKAGRRDEDHRRVQDVLILLVGLDVAVADLAEADALADGLAAEAHLFAIRLRRHADHVALEVDVILGKLDILERAIDLFVVTVEHADTQQHDARKVTVAVDVLQIRAVEQDLVLAHQLGRRREEHIVCRALAGSAELVRRVLLEDELAVCKLLADVVRLILPGRRLSLFQKRRGIVEQRIIQLHLEYLVYFLAVEDQVDLLVGPAEKLLVKVPEVDDEQDDNDDQKHFDQTENEL